MADHDKAGQGASAFRAFLRSLPDDIARAREDGMPVELLVDRPLKPHQQRLVDSLGVPVLLVNQGVRTAPAADGRIVILAAWCADCETEAMPDAFGRCSFCSRPIVDEDRLTARAAIAATNSNGGQIVTTCKIDGCDEQPEDSRGPYAGLCEQHKRERRAQRASTSRPPVPISRSGGASSVADACKELVKHGRSLDRARTQLAGAAGTEAAKAAFDEASRDASANPTPDALKRVSDAVADLQQVQPRRAKVEQTHAGALQSFKDQLGVVMGLIRP